MTKAMVLAAGVGSRLEPISLYIPKPLVPVMNKPVVTHILSLLKRHGISEVIANTHYMAQSLTDYFSQNPIPEMHLQFRFEAELSGDAGGVRACREFLGDDTFVVIMGDLITGADIGKLLQAHKAKGALATIGVKQLPDVTRFGVMLRDKQGFIKQFQEKPKPGEAISNEISTGIYVLEPEVFNHIPPSGVYGFGRQLFPTLVSKGLPVLGEEISGYWSDIGTLADLFRANMDALTGELPLEQALSCGYASYADVRLDREILLGERVKIGKGSQIGRLTIIGDDCEIGEGSVIEHCLIFSGSKIAPGSKLKDCIHAFGEQIQIDLPQPVTEHLL